MKFYTDEQIAKMKAQKVILVERAKVLNPQYKRQAGKQAASELAELYKIMGKIIAINRKLGIY